MGDITMVLERMGRGDDRAPDDLMALVYRELRTLAAAKLARETGGQTLQPTALVHEAWLRLGGDEQPSWKNRRHFFFAAAEAMRRVLIERARRRATERHGGGQVRVEESALDLAVLDVADRRIVAVSEALDEFAALDAPKAELVKLRYFGGLTLEQAAETLEISPATAKRWWAFARAWLYEKIKP
jgi:RNA polymerase sigma factor (TIGR02999 family)